MTLRQSIPWDLKSVLNDVLALSVQTAERKFNNLVLWLLVNSVAGKTSLLTFYCMKIHFSYVILSG